MYVTPPHSQRAKGGGRDSRPAWATDQDLVSEKFKQKAGKRCSVSGMLVQHA